MAVFGVVAAVLFSVTFATTRERGAATGWRSKSSLKSRPAGPGCTTAPGWCCWS